MGKHGAVAEAAVGMLYQMWVEEEDKVWRS